MGGNALKNCTTRRYAAEEYHQLANEVVMKLAVQGVRCAVIKSYRQKESFGDLDIVADSRTLPHGWLMMIEDEFKPKDWFKNGNVLSFEYKELQVDLIVTPHDEYETSLNYFAYNDLGNLCGRIAHMMGMKLGHDGLAYNWRIDETQHFRTVVIEKDWSKILPVLGLSYERYAGGFDTLEDIFKFVVSSPYFHKDIYLLHNRNAIARVRDKKRKTYTEFLEWIEVYEETALQVSMRQVVRIDKRDWLPYLFSQLPHFKTIYDEVQLEWDQAVEIKRRFNGDLVMTWTGLTGKELGQFMKWIREQGGERFRRDILTMNEVLVERFVTYYFEKWSKEKNGNSEGQV